MSAQNTTTTNTSGGGGIGESIKGAFKAVHGVGETLRGGINDAADQAGEGIAGAGATDAEKAERKAKLAGSRSEDHESVATKGVNEIKEGVNSFK